MKQIVVLYHGPENDVVYKRMTDLFPDEWIEVVGEVGCSSATYYGSARHITS
jgi:hypothetical protein